MTGQMTFFEGEPDPRDFETPTEAAAWDVYNCGRPPKAIACDCGMSMQHLSMKLSGTANLFANELDLIRKATGGTMIAKYFFVRDLLPSEEQRALAIQRMERQLLQISKSLSELKSEPGKKRS